MDEACDLEGSNRFGLSGEDSTICVVGDMWGVWGWSADVHHGEVVFGGW